MTSTPARDLGAFLKRARSRIGSPAAGTRARRRTTGLRREEVAVAAGISVTWYTWLEQGRRARCSIATLGRLADALQLSGVERAHLFALAGTDERATRPPRLTTRLPRDIANFVDGLAPLPAYAINGCWDVLHWNASAALAFGAFDPGSAVRGNVLTRLFLDEVWRTGFQDWTSTAESVVAQFRAATVRIQHSERVRAIVSQLLAESRAFAAWWQAERLAPSPIREKRFRHPMAGLLTFDYATLWPDAAPDDVRVVLYTPRGASRRRLAALGA